MTLSSLLPLGDVGTLRAASALFIALGRCTQRPYHISLTRSLHFSVRLSQRLYVVYNGIRAVQQVLAQFLEELFAGTGLYV